MNLEQNFSLIQIISLLRKHVKVILGSTLVVAVCATFFTFCILTPKYTATTEILVNRKLSSQMQNAQFQQVQADVQMINTYKDIITSPTVLQDVNREIKNYPGYPGSIDGLKQAISIKNSQNSQVFSVIAESSDANTAAAISNQVAQVFKKKIGKIMRVNNVSIVSKAIPAQAPSSPHKLLNLLAGLVLGVLVGVALAIVLELTNKTVNDEEFITNELGLINLGTVNEISQTDIEKISQERRHKLANLKSFNVKARRV